MLKAIDICLFLKNLSKNVSGKYSQKLLDHVKWSATDTFKAGSKREILKTADATGDMICDKMSIGDKLI